MPGCYAYQGWQLDSIQQMLLSTTELKHIIGRWRDFSFYSLPKIHDSHVITASYLIENIDMAFDAWKKRPWNKTLSFDDFCELILPYRIGNEPLSSWRKLYFEHYGSILDSVYKGKDQVEACRIICKELQKKKFRFIIQFDLPNINGEVLFYRPLGYCRDACDFTSYAMRACGIPTATDFFRYSADYQHYHSWNVLRDATGEFIAFDFQEWLPERDKLRSDDRKKGKVYRYCFGAQKINLPTGEMNNPSIPIFFRNPYIKDVTTDYFGENKVTITTQIKAKYIYLAVFSPNGWILIDKAKSKGYEATFRNIEPNVIYQPIIFDGTRQLAAGFPFIYKDKNSDLLEPIKTKLTEAILTRKMSIKSKTAERLYLPIIGSRIEASNDDSFLQAELLYEFKDTLTINYCELTPQHSSHKKFKYIRYSPPVGIRIELAELTLYEDSTLQSKIPLQIVSPIKPLDRIHRVTDDNILSYFQAKEATLPIVYKFEKASYIRKIAFSPRNDDNYISPGDVYELFYQDGVNGWLSLGIQTAIDRKLQYKTPQNALLWLRNRTKGREEQVFIYKNGRQYFTIDINSTLFQ